MICGISRFHTIEERVELIKSIAEQEDTSRLTTMRDRIRGIWLTTLVSERMEESEMASKNGEHPVDAVMNASIAGLGLKIGFAVVLEGQL